MAYRTEPADRPHIARLPKVVAGAAVSAEVAGRINAGLRALDASGAATAAECAATLAEGHNLGAGWRRSTAITMAGPRYFAVMLSDSYDCGGAYPNDDLRQFYVYDLTSGRPVNWLALFPRGTQAQRSTAPDGSAMGRVVSRTLARRAAAAATIPDCEGTLSMWESYAFTIGLDARAGTLVAVPSGLNHANQACATPVAFAPAELRRLNFAPVLVAAIEAAHRLQRAAR